MISGDGKNVLYYNVKINTQNVSEIKALIAQIDVIIQELMVGALASIRNLGTAEYYLDTGQNKTLVKYRSMKEVKESIVEFRDLRQMLVNDIENKCFGRVTQLVDQSNFRNRR